MKNTLFDITMAGLAITIVTCLVSLMAIFMGSGADFGSLTFLQAILSPVALFIVLLVAFGFVVTDGWAKGLRAIWLALPQWLVFIYLLLNSLFLSGEVAFVVVMQATGDVIPWRDHLPLVAMLLCSSAYLALHARRNSYPGSAPAMSGRWM